MALNKKIIGDKGIVVNYFRIADISQNYINPEPELEVYIYGYANEDFRLIEKEEGDKDKQTVVYFERFQLPLDDTKGYSREDIYNRLKTEVPLFEGAEDC
jgi:hypothetical protein